MTVFTNQAMERKVSFAAPYPGKIIPLNLYSATRENHLPKGCFFMCAKGVSVGIDFKEKLGTGFFGGEGFIMQKLEGDGLAFFMQVEQLLKSRSSTRRKLE